MSVAELEMKNTDTRSAILREMLEQRGIGIETGFEENYLVAVNGELERNLDRTVNDGDQILVVPIIVGG